MSAQVAQMEQDNTHGRCVVSHAQLPLHCPMDGDAIWSSHPRIFLNITAKGHAKCPYCGTEYTLKDTEGA